MQIRILSQQDVRQAISMKEAIASMREAFAELAKGHAHAPLRSVIKVNAEDASLFMPGFLSGNKQLGVKIVSAFPSNKARQIPAIHGVVILIDAETGLPKALMDASYLTALRTGAVSGLATDLLAAKEASVAAIIGAGVQARTQLEAVCAVRNIKEVRIYSRTHESAQALVDSIRDQAGFPHIIKICSTVSEACESADVICAATPATEPLVEFEHLKLSVHINAVGSHNYTMREIDESILKQALIVVDQKAAAIAEAGEIIHAIKNGSIQESDLVELGSLVNSVKFTRDFTKPSLFKSVGLSIQDVSVAEKVLSLSEQKGLGSMIDL
ncbi:MAG: ornithine cyclodeaminase family protein [Gammaproteobacteria bacterium]|nr:ornithine cyclodeaminase family protein [Gammaproteobacteria bacterium]